MAAVAARVRPIVAWTAATISSSRQQGAVTGIERARELERELELEREREISLVTCSLAFVRPVTELATMNGHFLPG